MDALPSRRLWVVEEAVDVGVFQVIAAELWQHFFETSLAPKPTW